jgi:hypothetical protein
VHQRLPDCGQRWAAPADEGQVVEAVLSGDRLADLPDLRSGAPLGGIWAAGISHNPACRTPFSRVMSAAFSCVDAGGLASASAGSTTREVNAATASAAVRRMRDDIRTSTWSVNLSQRGTSGMPKGSWVHLVWMRVAWPRWRG